MSEKWDRHFLSLALAHARMSKDPNTKTGAVIVTTDRVILIAREYAKRGVARPVSASAHPSTTQPTEQS